MKVIDPMPITDTEFVSSNIAENDYAAWASGTTYGDGARVILTSTHKIYESVQASNQGNNPSTDDGTWWIEVGATNRWKAFDQKISDQATNSGTITYTIETSDLVTGVAFLNLDASQLRVVVKDGGGTVQYDQTFSLTDTTEVVDWYTYFFEDIDYDSEKILVDLPAYTGYTIEITIGDGSGTIKVGQIVFGKVRVLGETLDGTELGIEDFSAKERDSFGNAYIVERAFAQTVAFDFALNTEDARRIYRTLTTLRATPAVYFMDEDATQFGATVYGYFRDFDIPLTAGGKSFATIEIEGLV